MIQNISSTWFFWKARSMKTKYFVCKNLVKIFGPQILKIRPKRAFLDLSTIDISEQIIVCSGGGEGGLPAHC